jgi:hypothetical protein
MVWLEDT